MVLKSLVMLKCVYYVAHIGFLKLTIVEQNLAIKPEKKEAKSTGVIKK